MAGILLWADGPDGDVIAGGDPSWGCLIQGGELDPALRTRGVSVGGAYGVCCSEPRNLRDGTQGCELSCMRKQGRDVAVLRQAHTLSDRVLAMLVQAGHAHYMVVAATGRCEQLSYSWLSTCLMLGKVVMLTECMDAVKMWGRAFFNASFALPYAMHIRFFT